MPMRSPDGSLILQICSGMKPGPEARIQGHHADAEFHTADGQNGSTHDNHGDAFKQKQCDYAAGAIAHLTSDITINYVSAAHTIVRIEGRRPLTGIFPPGLPPATGPPLI